MCFANHSIQLQSVAIQNYLKLKQGECREFHLLLEITFKTVRYQVKDLQPFIIKLIFYNISQLLGKQHQPTQLHTLDSVLLGCTPMHKLLFILAKVSSWYTFSSYTVYVTDSNLYPLITR